MPKLASTHYTIRSTSAIVGFWLGAGLLVIVAVYPLFTSQWNLALFAIPVAGFLIWALWLLLYRPSVHYDEKRVIVTNIGRIHILPWSSIESMDQKLSLIFFLNNGKRIAAQGTPYPRRRNTMALSQVPPKMRQSRNYDGDISVLDGFRKAAVPDDTPASHLWDTTALLIGCGTFIIVFLAVLIDTIR